MFGRENNQTSVKYLQLYSVFSIRVLFMLTLIAVFGAMCINNVYAGTIRLPQTGQTVSYASGDDSAIKAGVAWPVPRLMDNGDQTVTDKLTGLIWAQEAGTATVGGCLGGPKTWHAALDYVACLNAANYLGHNDWRLPNINELQSLIDGQRDNPALPSGHPFQHVQSNGSYTLRYWSSTALGYSGTEYVWTLIISDGFVAYAHMNNQHDVWPVRGSNGPIFPAMTPQTGQTVSYASGDDGAVRAGVAWPDPRFTDNGDQTLTDQLTGLVWPSDAGTPSVNNCTGGQMNWQAALSYVSCLNTNNYLGHNDWRLPNRTELRSIVDFGTFSPTFKYPFHNGDGTPYWSSSTCASSMVSAWIIGTYGPVEISQKAGYFLALPVRNGSVTPACTSYTVTPASRNLPSTGGTDSVNVTANTGCAWTASSNVAWITINAGSSGSGNGNVSYTVAANTGTSSRTGTMTIAGQAFTVTQAAATPTCTSYTITPTSKSFPSSVGTDSVSVTANTGCSWSASSNAAWITINAGSSGSGNGSVSYTVAANTATTQRTGSMTIAGQTFTVTQEAKQDCSNITITPTTKNFPSNGGFDTVSVTANAGCTWSALSNDTWITINGNSAGTGNGTVSYTVSFNSGQGQRTGTMAIAGQTFTVTQDAAVPTCTNYTITPISNNFPATGGTDSISVTTNAGCPWTASGSDTWITINAGSSGSGNGSVSYTVAANTGVSTRTSSMTIAGLTFKVTQDGTGTGIQVNLTVTKQGTGDGTVTSAPGTITWSDKTGTASFDKDTSVTLTATPILGSTVKAWTGCVSIGNNNCMVTMSADKVVTVEFDSGSSGRRVRHDFNGDGHADVLWRNTTTGDVAIWLMDGMKINGGDFIAKGVSADWDVKAIGDFNGDGKADVLWQNAAGDVYIWIVEGTTIKTGGFAVRGMPGEWEVTALGDFNGDGNDDIMWRNANSGDVYVWFMNGTDIKGGGYVVKGLKSEWVVKAIADFNGDGTSDVLWQNTTTGDVAMWLMDGLSMSTGNYVAQGVPDNWQIKGIDDFDGDSNADVLWQNSSSGDVYMYIMDGMSISSGGMVSFGLSGDWQPK